MSHLMASLASTLADRGPSVPAASYPSLEWLLSPIPIETFFSQFWEKQTLVVRRNRPTYFDSIFSLAEADRVLTTLDCKYPEVTLKNARKPVIPTDYTIGGGTLDIPSVCQLHHEGATIAMAYLDTRVPSLARLCHGLQRDFRCLCQTNVYLTPPGAQGAKPHYDTHDVLILQIAGSKRWTIYGVPLESPLSSQEFDPAVHALGEPTAEFVLHPGDSAYVPRGHAHEACTTGELSLHITAGILQTTWTDFLMGLVGEAALNDPLLRKALPPEYLSGNFSHDKLKPQLQQLIEQALKPWHIDSAVDRCYTEFIDACSTPAPGQLLQSIALDDVKLDSVVEVRPGLIFRQWREEEVFFVQASNRTISFPTHLEPAIRFALGETPFTIDRLPGTLDGASKLTLMKRLLSEGLLHLVPPAA